MLKQEVSLFQVERKAKVNYFSNLFGVQNLESDRVESAVEVATGTRYGITTVPHIRCWCRKKAGLTKKRFKTLYCASNSLWAKRCGQRRSVQGVRTFRPFRMLSAHAGPHNERSLPITDGIMVMSHFPCNRRSKAQTLKFKKLIDWTAGLIF